MLVFWWLGAAAMLHAQQPNVHYWHQGVLPPGAIGSRQLQRGGPLPGFFQPVEIQVPPGAELSLAVDGRFDQSRPGPRKAGMLIGAVYRMRVTNIRLAKGAEVFPTVEVIDRLYAPVGQELRFPIPIDITEADLKLALAGKFVTRVIYLEDPRHALPARQIDKSQNWFDTAPGQDPLTVADGLGRPVAILRLGARLPDQGSDPFFFFGSPPFMALPAQQAAAPTEAEAAPQRRVQQAAAIGTAVDLPQNPLRTAVELPSQPTAADGAADGVAVQLPRQRTAAVERPVGMAVELPPQLPAAVERPPEHIPLPSHRTDPTAPSVNNLPPPPDATPPAQPTSAARPVGQTFLSAKPGADCTADMNVCPTLNNTGLAREGLRQS